MRHGGGRRSAAIADWIGRQQPDIAVLTEYRQRSSGVTLPSALARIGLTHQMASTKIPRQNGVMVASRLPFRGVLPATFDAAYEHRCIRATFNDIEMYCLYFPNKQAKEALFDFLLSLPEDTCARSTLLVGDFNTGRHFEDEPGKILMCVEQFEALLAAGWVDAWRARHPRAREFTWYSHMGGGFRLDHALMSPSLAAACKVITYDHSVREQGLSDHSAIVVEW